MMIIYDVVLTNKFKKQYAKIKKRPNFNKGELKNVINMLTNNELLPPKYKNHLLIPKSKRHLGMSHTTRRVTGI